MTEQLKVLERRLAEATGPSEELDYAIWRAFDEPTDPASWQPQYSYSIDSAVGLASRVLPGWGWLITCNGGAAIWDKASNASANMLGKTPALALCTAIVRALMQKEG